MHLIETYALASGSKIGKPYIYEKFFPLPFEKYITIHPNSSCDSKNYDYWQEVVDFLHSPLLRNGFKIIQIGKKEDKKLNLCVRVSGQTNINQIAYLIKGSSLHLGADSFPTHVASSYKKKIVCLYSNNYKEVVGPYWGDSKDHVLFQDLEGKRASFSTQESPKTINNIKPEDVANSVLRLLDLDYRVKYKTAIRGSGYLQRRIESIPNCVVDCGFFGIDTVIVRMDLLFCEDFLIKQLNNSNCCIITNKAINLDIIKRFKERIKQFVYILDESHNPSFVRELQSSGIEYHLESKMSEEELNAIKLYYLDYNPIIRKLGVNPKTINEIKSFGCEDMVYRSKQFLLSNGKIYQSEAALEKDLPITDLNGVFSRVIDSEIFWRDMDKFYLLKPID